MKAQISAATHKTLSKAWHQLRTKHFQLNGFDSLDHLIDEFDGVQCDGPFYYKLSRIDPDLLFEPGNVRLSPIRDDEDLTALSWPCL